MKSSSDEQLVQEVQQGNIPAFEALVNKYQHKLISFVVSVVRDHHAAQDIVQETFIHLYKTIERVHTDQKFSSYLYAIARNQAISFLRKRKTHVDISQAEDIAGEDSPELYAQQRDEQDRVESALAQIDKKYRKVLTLYYYDNLSYEEISKVLHLPVNTIRTHLRRAKAALKSLFLS